MKFTQDQEKASQVLTKFLKDSTARVARLTGYAGTGKTTMISYICNVWRELNHKVRIVAPTGKAALRIQEATGEVACTIHRLFYRPQQDPETGEVSFLSRSVSDLEDLEGALIVIDEASMVSRKVWEYINFMAQKIGLKVLLIGDTFQLEPVSDERGDVFSALTIPVEYEASLKEVVRQALDSPVLLAATIVRQAKSPIDISHALENLIPIADPVDLAISRPDIPILVHRNVTRHQLNNDIRQRKGLSPNILHIGEPLLVLRNNYNVMRYNGEIVTIDFWPQNLVQVPVRDRRQNKTASMNYGVGRILGAPAMSIESYLGSEVPTVERQVVMCLEEISGNTNGIGEFPIEIGYKYAYQQGRIASELTEKPPLLHCNYGYTLTTHKAQGAEWPEVIVVIEPSISMHTESGRKHLYTSLTRAQNKAYWTYL